MSLKTWKAEFYPRPAESVKTKRAAVLHSIRKWEGLLPENLKRHGVEVDMGDLIDEYGKLFQMDESSCALCQLYLNDTCVSCPLSQARGSVPCDSEKRSENTAPYKTWFSSDDPKPMLRWLRKALKFLETRAGAK